MYVLTPLIVGREKTLSHPEEREIDGCLKSDTDRIDVENEVKETSDDRRQRESRRELDAHT